MADEEQPAFGMDGIIEEVAAFWGRAVGSGRRFLAGQYTIGDALADVDAWASAVSGCAARLTGGQPGGQGRPTLTAVTGWTARMTVLPTVSERPLTLLSTALRAIGSEHPILVPASDVSFDPAVVPPGSDSFTVTVSFDHTPSARTLIVEGNVEARETGSVPISDPVRANNRDGGPVR